ncbi:peptidoglycan-binding protein [Aurantimonas marina]|uniref:peptidoglycan-binding protein n=1 Tax=Aurantimonas marina TaxID=2780508 RepID=UPI0019CF5EF9|nr:peptidoglycan-binding protein [Aurantimonas marina]
MADQTRQGNGRKPEDASALDALSRTLEELEKRLSRVSAAKQERERPAGKTPAPGLAEGGGNPKAARPTFSDAVSQIVMRQKMLEREPVEAEAAPTRQRAAAGGLDVSGGDDAGSAAMTDLAQQLEWLRAELRDDMTRSLQPRFDDMRAAFDDLRKMIAERASADRIDAEISKVDHGLIRMVDNGADHETIRSLREELEAIRGLVGATAREDSVQSVGRRWDMFETKLAGQSEEESKARHELKDELERLRTSLGSLASEEQVKAVERRWDEFENRYLAAPAAGEGAGLSDLLKNEMDDLREKLETLASEKSMRAVEERWDALEDRFASREIEGKIEAMGERMEQLETALAKLPETLAIEPLQQRVHALAVGIEALAQRQQDESDLDHFAVLDERLDEISRAIMVAANRAPAIDMSPVERIEARLQSLTARVDELAEDGDSTILSDRISELADRIELLSNDNAAQELAERIERFSRQLENFAVAGDGGPVQTLAMETRLQSLAERLDEVSAPRVDEEIVKALEVEIRRLSQKIDENGMPAAIADPELDQRLADIERRLDEHREDIVVSARAAADEAIRQMIESGDLRQGEHVARLSEDLRALEALSRDSGAQSEDFFRTVQSTLSKLVERIDQIESEITGKGRTRQDELAVSGTMSAATPHLAAEAQGLRAVLARTLKGRKSVDASGAADPAARSPRRSDDPELMLFDADAEAREQTASSAAVEAPSLDAADIFDTPEANRPLAIGSGTPDITALLERVRAQQAGRSKNGEQDGKADFIAAARRAAMAAAAEAESLDAPEARVESGKVSLTDTISRRRKPILMAIGAVLLALMALPLGQALTSTPDADGEFEPAVFAAKPSVPTTKPAASVAATANMSSADAEAKPASGVATPPTMPDGLVLPTATSPALQDKNREAAGQAGAGEGRAPADGDVMQDSLVSRSLEAQAGAAPAPATASTAIPSMPENLGNEALSSAVRDGDPKALFEVGLRLMEGRKGEPDARAAATWFTMSAERDFAPAQYSLGTLYEKGNGVARDTSLARDWYVKAADQGNVRAMHNLAVLYATGVDGKSDPKLAARWFEKAAEFGMTDSQYNLGILYARGAGVDVDFTESFKWFSVVTAAGDEDAGRKRDEIKKSLTPAQLEQAEAKVAAYKPKPRDDAVNTVEMPKEWTDKEDVPIHTSSIDMTRAVRNIQAILIKLGYEPGAPDGIAGAQTTEAIKSFQKEAGLQPTGDINESLIRALLARKDG